MAIDKTKHKANCACVADESKACDCGGVPAPATETRVCFDCDAVVSKTEKTCPKCKADLTTADEEDNVVERAIKRLKKKRKATPPTPGGPAPESETKKHVFSSLRKLVK